MALRKVAHGVTLYRDTRSGGLVAKRKHARRGGGGGRRGGGMEGDFEGDDFEGDDFEGIIGADFGDAEDRLARKERRWARRDARHERHRDRVRGRLGDSEMNKPAVVSGAETVTGAGSATVEIRLQHDMEAEDITFSGSTAGTVVNSIFFGDDHVWSSSDGVPVAVFDTSSFLRGFLRGRVAKGGYDIKITGTLTGAGTLRATITGTKP